MELRIRLCRVLGLAILLAIGGCSNDADPEEPVVLGVPPDTAYLGVEYAYNFGAYGGDDILDFSLANAPAWLGFEDTANKARTGVILRGVPGITGGRRGEADLGKYSRISVNATDGSRLGGNYFDVTVEHNVLALVDADVTEGESYLPAAAKEALERAKDDDFEPEEDEACVPPDVDQKGSYTASDVPVYDDNGGFTLSDRDYETHPVVVAVTLAHPSVEPVTVGFSLTSAFACEAGATPDECEYAGPNQNDAKPLEDYVANSGTFPEPPEYLQYTGENEGIVTFAPGKTTCFIRLEVLDDRLPEFTETLRLELTDVREGLASLTATGAERRATIRIEDNEPTVSFEPNRLIVTEGASRQVTARLNKTNDTGAGIRVRVVRDAERSTADEQDFQLAPDAEASGSNTVTVEIPNGAQEATFVVTALNDPGGQGEEGAIENTVDQQDDVLTLMADVSAQFGRENYARAGTASTEVVINEWVGTLDFSGYADFIPTAIVAGTYGELYIAGVQGNVDAGTDKLGDESGEHAIALALDRFGTADPDDLGLIFGSGGNTRIETPKIAFSDRTDTVGSERVLTRTMALGYTVASGALGQQTSAGGADIGISYLERKNGGVYDNLWSAQVGSNADDRLVDVRTNSGVGVAFGANTYGNWPISERQSYQGDQDIVLGQVRQNGNFGSAGDDTDDDCNNPGCLAWARMIGTPTVDRLAAAPTSGGNTIFASGETRGAIEPDKTFGGAELFFIRTDTGDLNFISQQYGTAEEDSVSDAAYIGTGIWTTGSSRVPYKVTASGLVASDTLPKATRNPYVIVFTANEAAKAAISLVSDSANENINAIDGLTDYGVIGGDTDGTFQEKIETDNRRSAILARLSFAEPPVEEDEEAADSGDDQPEGEEEEEQEPEQMQVDWRYQMSGTTPTRVIDLALSRNGKVFALIEEGEGDGYSVILLDDRGGRLDPPPGP